MPVHYDMKKQLNVWDALCLILIL